MTRTLWAGKASRKIVRRIVVEGDLVLQTPACLGSGDTDRLVDMPLLVDPLDGRTPLLTGASIAGALRSYLRERERGRGGQADAVSASVLLFGARKGDEEGEQSPLIVDDALGQNFGLELRHGVAIDPKSRTAREERLFDLELWQAGTTFPLRFELIIREEDDEDKLMQALATALEGFNDGSITLGARKRRGYGRVRVPGWSVKRYDLTTSAGLLDWIENGDKPLDCLNPVPNIKAALRVEELLPDRRQFFHLKATFSLNGSLLIRAAGGEDDRGPDMVHLHSRQADGSVKPVLCGTSVAGSLRARGLKIANTIGDPDRGRALIKGLIEGMFGPETEGAESPRASRVLVSETVIENARTDLVQSRVSVDRFTGGARETALFNEQPAFDGDDTSLCLDVRLLNPEDYEIGLLLLLLKDLWTGDLPLGGEASIGRGRLKGRRATLTLKRLGVAEEWSIAASGSGLAIEGDRAALERFVRALKKHLEEGAA